MRNKVIKILCCLLLSVSGICLLSSCGGNMSENDAKAILEELLPKSYEFNDIFWGCGLDYDEPAEGETYAPVKEMYGYISVDDMLTKAGEVFSEEYMATVKSAVFDGNEDEGINPRYKDIEGVLKIDTTNFGFEIKGEIDISSVKIKQQNSKAVTMTGKYKSGGVITIQIVFENNTWKLNTATY